MKKFLNVMRGEFTISIESFKRGRANDPCFHYVGLLNIIMLVK
ncbi:hypothetical protein FHS90_003813 [Rufibacter quisquiliarum]|uniref:Uncharacterized protein n=1 Tax=Rufibacter quisquiliarum TaxID=1549639 RepID=A0A839GXB6_9BACT|nr:hypothetical protein [Rufibacter quisquiliarum]